MNQKKPRGFLNEAVWPNRITVRQDAISDSYAIETRPFARGKFATVRRCRHIESGRDFAAKYLRKRRRAEDVRHELIHEALVLALADSCKRIISLKEIFETPTEVILVLEMAAGGELQHVLDAEDCLPECSVRQLLLQIAEGLAFLHSQHIAHLDIKPANLLLSAAWPQVDAKLCDFGISRLILPGEEIHEIAGTPDYIAPEVLQYEPISLSTDMWSLGILTYVLLTGHTPFGGDTKQDTYCNITLGELDFPQDLFKDVTSEAIHFITQLVVKDPKKRLSIGEVLKHPWLTQPSPCPSFLAITAVIGVTNDNTSHLVANSNNVNNNNIHSNGKNSNKITNGIASYGLVVDSEQSPNPREDQEAVERLRGGAAVVQCETPSSSSIGSCEESDAEIIMEDQRGLQHQQPQSKQQIVNEDSSSDTINMNSDNNSRRSQSRNGVVEAKQTRGSSPVMAKRAIVNEVETPNVVAVAGHDDVVPNNPADSTIGVQLQHGETSEQLVQIHESSGEERVSVPDSASPAPEEELPSLQSSTSSSSSDSPVPAKKDKECEARPLKDVPKPRKASLPPPLVVPKSVGSSGFVLASSGGRAFQPSPIDYSSSLSPQVSPTLRRSVALPCASRLPSMRPLTRSTSVSPVRTVLSSKTPLTPSKSLSSPLSSHHSSCFKLNNNSAANGNSTQQHQHQAQSQSGTLTTYGRRATLTSAASPSSSHALSALPRRIPSSSLKRPQPTSTPKQSKTSSGSNSTATSSHSQYNNISASHNHSSSTHVLTSTASSSTNNSAHAHKASTTFRPSLLSPTVSSALKSCAVPLRAVNSLSRADCEIHGCHQQQPYQHHRRSLILSPSSTQNHHHHLQENKGTPINKRSSLPERSMKKPVKGGSTPSASLTPTTGSSTVVRRSSAILDRTKTAAARKSMELEGLRRKTFNDDVLVCQLWQSS